jgi:DNA-binding IclR family transcriptional regulator
VARPAPSVDRTIRLLNYFAANPGEQYALSDIARRLEFNKATCHAMLNELVNAGVLLRNPATKTYGLGPTLVTWGVASAFDAYQALEFAEPEMERLRERLDASCVARGMVGHDTVVLARRDTDRPIASFMPVGHRLRAVPPIASEFMAWADETVVAEWLGRLDVPLDDPEVDRHRQLLEDVREQRYRLLLSEATDLEDLLDELRTASDDEDQLDDTLDELFQLLQQRGWSRGPRSPSVVGVIAPVFGPGGTPVLALSLSGLRRPVSPDEAQQYVRPLVDACRRITKSIGGQPPEPQPTPEPPSLS